MTENNNIVPIWQATFILTSCHAEKDPLIIKTNYGEIHIVNEGSEKEKKVKVSINIVGDIEKEKIVEVLHQKIIDFYACFLPIFVYSTFSIKQRILNVDFKLANIDKLIKNLGKKAFDYGVFFSFTSEVPFTFTEENIVQIEMNLKAIEKLPVRIKQILSLYLSALQSDQPYAAIALFWTSFEMIYKYERRGEDVPLINDYIHRKISKKLVLDLLTLVLKPIYLGEQQAPLQIELILNWDTNNIADVLIKLDLTDKHGQKNFSDELKNLISQNEQNIKNVNQRTLLSYVFRCLYSIRSNIVHGNEDFYNKVDQNQAKVLFDIFRIIIGIMLNDFIGSYLT